MKVNNHSLHIFELKASDSIWANPHFGQLDPECSRSYGYVVPAGKKSSYNFHHQSPMLSRNPFWTCGGSCGGNVTPATTAFTLFDHMCVILYI